MIMMFRIMGKYVYAAQERAGLDPQSISHQSQSACPFARAFTSMDKQAYSKAIEDGSPVLDVLSRDPRVSSELAINLVMALFRTGIDSVSEVSLMRCVTTKSRNIVTALLRLFCNLKVYLRVENR
jgi:hypothetical protein